MAKKEKNRETNLKEIGGGCRAYGALSFSPFCSMAESSWPVLEVTQEHVQNLASQWRITMAFPWTLHLWIQWGIRHAMHGVL
jgi:hypothetical protein